MDPGIIFQGKSNCSEKNRSYCERSEQQQIEKNDGQNCKKTLTYPPPGNLRKSAKERQNRITRRGLIQYLNSLIRSGVIPELFDSRENIFMLKSVNLTRFRGQRLLWI